MFFLAAPAVDNDIRRLLQDLKEQFGQDASQYQQCEGLWLLCTEYCPALVDMGISIRQCYWTTQQPGTGAHARNVIRDAICLLTGLQKNKPSEYLRNLCMMHLLWTPFHDDIPAAAYVEECLESSLSVLSRRQRTDARITTVSDFSDAYTCLIVYVLE